MTIIQDLIPNGWKNRPGRANPMRYITIHNTGNTAAGAGARNHANYIKGDTAANLPVSWHYTVDDKLIIQHMPDNEIAWHCGDGGMGVGNTQSIGIEICMNSDGDLLQATENAVWLTAKLCAKHGILIENIVQHHRWSGKNCPQMLRSGRPFNWETFIKKVREQLSPKRDEHWAEEFHRYLTGLGMELDRRFDDGITRGEVMTMITKYDEVRKKG
jgi:N-acetylmuramoyl-L-alanine amidase